MKCANSFATPDHKATTIAKLLIEHVVCRHRYRRCWLFDRITDFLSDLITEICQLLATEKTNTTAYHPQTGILERMNETVVAMLANTRNFRVNSEINSALFAICVPGESALFFAGVEVSLLYGRDARILTETSL